MKRLVTPVDRYIHLGLLVLRIGLGIMLVFHGGPKLFGGPEMWIKVGSNMSLLGINFWFMFWGLLAALSEFIGGILLIAGLYFTPACSLLLVTMLVATIRHLSVGDPFSTFSHPMELGIVFLSLIITGPGRHRFGIKLFKRW
ncbi:MAG: DoxX family protein [Bacteroidota bacterium]|nr:DoxX family protein [Bacteroidota bacterium]